jgi:inner membrane protein
VVVGPDRRPSPWYDCRVTWAAGAARSLPLLVMRRWLPVAAVAAVLVMDLVRTTVHHGIVVEGLLDETAHVLTAWLLLAAVVPGAHAGLLLWTLVGATAVDLDHVPLLLHHPGWAVDGGRPPTHSLALVAALLLAGRLVRPGVALTGLGTGVLLHLVRDLATGPGVPLLWPVEGTERAPYLIYGLMLALATTVALIRRRRPVVGGRSRTPGQTPRRISQRSTGRRYRRHVQREQSEPLR